MSLEIIGIIASAAGTLFNVVGKISEGNAQAKAAQYQAQVAANNQIIAQQNATYARQAAAARENTVEMKTANLIGAVRAAQGANGLDVNSGTSLDIQASTYAIGKLDATNTRIAGEREAAAYESQAMNFGATADLYRFRGSQSQLAGYAGGLGSLIGGASSVSDKWLRYQQSNGGDQWGGDWSVGAGGDF